jgi:NAD(P)H-dependent FMN reductase
MKNISILSASVRAERKSSRVALFLQRYINENKLANAEIIDLNDYQFPIFHERLKYQQNPLPAAVEFADKIGMADGVIIVTPEYNGGIPAALKNAVDLLIDEWIHKPVAIATASSGMAGGAQVTISLQFSLWKMKAITVPALFPTPTIEKSYDEDGNPFDKEATERRAAGFVKELLWFVEAKERMKEH